MEFWKKILLIILILLLLICIFKQNNNEFFENNNNLWDYCYVINLKETEEGKKRWKKIKNHYYWKNKKFERYQGFYGKNMDFTNYFKNNILQPEWNYGKWKGDENRYVNLTKGELGCILSHRGVWEKIVKNNIQNCLVLEDDALNIDYNFDEKLKIIKNYLPNDWDILLLGFWLHKGDNSKKINNHIYKVKDFALAHSYIINLKCAKKILKLKPIDKPLDSWLSSISNKINIYRHNFIKPNRKNPSSSLIGQIKENSQIIHTNNY